ncbi:ankyrin repeat domain-containing protein [Sporosarcina limicola]|uniref:SLH domain-containing protein n=1 Tax=Sporosarcina limicola TaxID=34101 RepID=A0A927RGF6_9BACL|nr:ankyrin repeat domain-containing protein [Sporosarcina limicola]MBE1556472.1 hypothetical protein [Sporosarcina limicola]
MLKRCLFMCFTLLLVLAFSSPTQVNAIGFTDVNLYKEEITYLADKGIIQGYPDGTFKPTQNLTRLQAVTMILREKKITEYSAPNPNFTDVKPGSHGYEIIAKAVDLGFISGKTNKDGSKYFDASSPVTRGQMAKILVKGYQLSKKEDVNFTDVVATNSFKDYISVLSTENITKGYSDGSFKPNNNLSRQHFALFMARLLADRAPSQDPNPPLIKATNAGDFEKVKALLKSGVNPNVVDRDGKTALYAATSNVETDIMSLLLEYGADPNIQDNYGYYPLMGAIYPPHNIEMIRMLLEAGANPTIKDNDGHDAFYMAKENGNIPEVIKLLEQFSKIKGEND